MRRIVLDTSSIVFAFSNKVDIFAVVEERLDAMPVVSEGILRELKRLSARRNREGRAAKLALEVMKGRRTEVLASAKPVDDFLVVMGVEKKASICTNDVGLKRRLRAAGVRPLSISRNGVLR